MWLLCLFLPPVAILFTGKPFRAILAVFLCALFWVPGVIYAFATVNAHKQDKRFDRLARQMDR